MAKDIVGEVLAIGDEIICGKLLDTNSQWLSQKLGELGVSVRFHTTIGDRQSDYQTALQTATSRADIIVCSGGLGPTEDDLTSGALAQFAGVDLEFDDASWAHIQSLFHRRNRPLPASNRKQALRPRSSRSIFNPNGTAPGIAFPLPEINGRRCHLFAFPGVPAELREMWPAVESEIRSLVGRRVFFQHSLHCFGAGESYIESLIPTEIMRRGRDPLVGITASQATISLRVSTLGESLDACRKFAGPTIDQLRIALGDWIYGEQDDSLESVVVQKLAARGLSLSLVDMGLEGEAFRRLRAADSRGTTVVGSLQLSRELFLQAFPALRETQQSANAFLVDAATHVRELLRTDLGLAIGPFPNSSADPQALEVGASGLGQSWFAPLRCAGHPALRLTLSTKSVVNFLRTTVLGN